MRKVQQAGGVEGRVCSIGRQCEGQAARYEAVEGGVEVASGRQYALLSSTKQTCERTYRVAVLISPDSEMGELSVSFSGGAPSPLSNMVASAGVENAGGY